MNHFYFLMMILLLMVMFVIREGGERPTFRLKHGSLQNATSPWNAQILTIVVNQISMF